MAITLSGDGIARANLAADIIDSTKLADDAVNSEHYVDASIDNAHLADDAVGVAELSATGTASSSTFLRGDNSWQTVSTPITALNNATANELVTVGSTTTELDAEAKLTFSNSKLTIGDGTAEDAYVKFDGNAVDYYVGIDDTYDTLSMGIGGTPDSSEAWALGTWDGQVAIRKSVQPCFSVHMSANQTGTSAQIYNTLPMDSESYDVGSNWNTTNHNFTAPITGKWLVCVTYGAKDWNNAGGELILNLTTSNRSYKHRYAMDALTTDAEWWYTTISHICDFDTDDTMSFRWKQETQAGFGTEWYGGASECRATGYFLG